MESQRAIRRLLPDPVPDELVLRMIELAEKAPNGGNEQWFAFVVVKDPKVRAGLAQLNRWGYPGLRFYYRKRIRDDARWARTWAAIEWQKDHFEEIPVLVIVCANRRIPPWPRLMNAGVYASTYPATQNPSYEEAVRRRFALLQFQSSGDLQSRAFTGLFST